MRDVPYVEFERRFLVKDRSVVTGHLPTIVNQAYLFVEGGWAIRVRRSFAQRSATNVEEASSQLAIKGPREGTARQELEWPIPSEVAEQLFVLATMKISKSRFHIIDSNFPWDVDVFHGDNEGLVIAECEATDPRALDDLAVPWWCGEEVTNNPRYNNEELARNPLGPAGG
ncbi:MAG TPA: hypothetical protein VIG64_15345 [Actinomycetota bacterium]